MTATAFSEASTSRFARIKEGDLDLQLHYNDLGEGAETVVMLHGSGPGASGWANFNRNIEPLVNAGFRVILMDCPGWSKSDTIVSEGSRSNLNAQALKGLLDQNRVGHELWQLFWYFSDDVYPFRPGIYPGETDGIIHDSGQVDVLLLGFAAFHELPDAADDQSCPRGLRGGLL